MIDKKNKLWTWKKADKQTKDWYHKQTGLQAREVGTMSKKAWDAYMALLSTKQEE